MTTQHADKYRHLETVCEAGRVLAAATLAGELPFLGVFGAREALARTYGDFESRVGGYAYLDAVKAGMVGGKVYADANGMIDQSRRVGVTAMRKFIVLIRGQLPATIYAHDKREALQFRLRDLCWGDKLVPRHCVASIA